MKVKFTKFDNTDNWVKGKCGKYNFEAKLYDEVSCYGIDDGRVSKLSIWDEKVRKRKDCRGFIDACVVNYDRGWDIEPNDDVVEIYAAIMETLESSPKRFEGIDEICW